MPRRAEGRITGQPVTQEIPQPAGGVKLVTFIPWTLVKRGMKKEIITPIDAPAAFTVEAAAERQRKKAEQVAPVVRALGLAYYWQQLLDDGKFASLTEIAKVEGLNRGYVTRVAGLTKLAPAIVERALNGRMTLEQTLRLGSMGCWKQQRDLSIHTRLNSAHHATQIEPPE